MKQRRNPYSTGARLQCTRIWVWAMIGLLKKSSWTNDLFFKFRGDCLAGRSGEEGSRDNKSVFKKVNIREARSSISKCPTSFKVGPSLTPPQSSSRWSRGWWKGKRVSLPLFRPSRHNPRATKERQRERERDDLGRVRVPHVTARQYLLLLQFQTLSVFK